MPQSPEQQTIEIQVDKHVTPNYQPARTSKSLANLSLNCLVVTYTTGLVTQMLLWLPVTASIVPVLPQVVIGIGALAVGSWWALKKQVHPSLAANVIALAVGVLLGV